MSIEEGTFEPLSDLEEVDLSTNALRTVPLELFNLPSLRNLYLDSNNLIELKNDLIVSLILNLKLIWILKKKKKNTFSAWKNQFPLL